jgi:hypothetical protein
MALELRPTCENCGKKLPPEALDAWICSFECTYCSSCVKKLGNVCPNCGGGFMPRPIRPAKDRKDGNYLGNYPASTVAKQRPIDFVAHARFAASLKDVPPEKR